MIAITLIRNRWSSLIFIAVLIVFTLVFMVIQLRRFHLPDAQAFDLGIFQQGVWLLANGYSPFVTVQGWR